MPNFSGIWSTAQQFQARGQNIWPKPPDAPTIGTATAGTNNCASVTFSAPACTGKYPSGVSSYTVTSTPGSFTASGASSPLTVTGLTTGTAYTFKVKATGSNGLTNGCSAASNSITATVATSASYTTAGTYSWVAPTGVTSVAVVAIGGGGGGQGSYFCPCIGYLGTGAGSGGGLGWKNNRAVTPGSSYTVVVGGGGAGSTGSSTNNGGTSYFVSTCVVSGTGGRGGIINAWAGQAVGTWWTGDGGGKAGWGGYGANQCGGAGAGGAAGYNGGGACSWSSTGVPSNNDPCVTTAKMAGLNGGAGGGYAGKSATYYGGAGGGGTGIFGQGSSGAAGSYGGSGGTNGVGAGLTDGSGSSNGGNGGTYGGGGGGSKRGAGRTGGSGGSGAVRIVWCISGVRGTPSFPSTNVGP